MGAPCAGGVSGSSCVVGSLCLNSPSLLADTGTCVATNALSNGRQFSVPPGNLAFLSYFGAFQCASTLSVPVPNASGYTAGVGACVASLDDTGAGLSCGASCPWANGNLSDLRTSPGGNLVCAPVAQPGLPCAWLPSSVFDFSATMPGYIAAQACLAGARGPTGVACPGTGNRGPPPIGSCAYYRCLAPVVQGTAQLTPTLSPLWAQYFAALFTGSGQTTPEPACVVAVDSALSQWQASQPLATACSYSLPAAFAARRWTCDAGTAFSLSPSPTPPSTPTATPSQTVTTGLTPTATPTQTVTTGLTPTASPQWAPPPANNQGSSSAGTPSSGVIAGVVIGVLAALALAGAVTWWMLRRALLQYQPSYGAKQAGIGGVDLVIKVNPAAAADRVESWHRPGAKFVKRKQ